MASITIDVPSGKSWKTTLFGLVTAAGAYLSAQDDPTMKIVGQVLMIAGPVLMGFFAKDSSVTGGTVVQPSSIEAKEAVTTAPAPVVAEK